MEKHFEFDSPGLLTPVAMGAPGKRTFFLMIGEKERWLRVWLEKYLLEALAMAVDEFLVRLAHDHVVLERRAVSGSSVATASKLPLAELEVNQISLDFDDNLAVLSIEVHSMGPQRADGIELTCRIPLADLKEFALQAQAVCAGGRPRCSLCGEPIDPGGHSCNKLS